PTTGLSPLSLHDALPIFPVPPDAANAAPAPDCAPAAADFPSAIADGTWPTHQTSGRSVAAPERFAGPAPAHSQPHNATAAPSRSGCQSTSIARPPPPARPGAAADRRAYKNGI